MFRACRFLPTLEMRQWELADAEVCFESVARNRRRCANGCRGWTGRVPRKTCATTFAEGVDSAIRGGSGPQLRNLARAASSRAAIGCHPIDWANRSCAFGYWLDEKFRGQGVITQCCAALLGYLFEELKLHRVCIRCATGNTRSCAIPQRLGFRQEGIELEAEWVAEKWLDLWVWGMLEGEWRQSPYAVTATNLP